MGFADSLLTHFRTYSIHQPSSELFQIFDRLLLLRKGGQTTYFGDLGENSSTLISYFERNGARTCDQHENPYVSLSGLPKKSQSNISDPQRRMDARSHRSGRNSDDDG